MNAGAEARIRQAVAELADAIVAAVDDGPPPAPDRLYDVGEAATTLGIQRSKLYGLMPPGELCSVKVGRRRLVPGRRHRRVRCPGGQRMSRDDGFGIADMDGGLLNDAKVHQLIRATRHEGLVARCLIGYTAVLLASWQQRYRVPFEDAAPIWLTDLDDLAERLCAARILDADHVIPMNAWAGWFGPVLCRPAHPRRHATGAGRCK